ncbi:uncharacterized protein PV09_00319 [Verruconis gallopava]|uniref:Pet127-domain-containing protein n=1 Tax=Verruconis gallopava TaxID=253628 RepID=A0A0D2BDC6_9PEZI|nr:uncharacterized protein PV09_00319 [Verruconis gallopava]KIW09434.1 hypothetical protein PV09_00319 [Verruconis gallopava]
MSGFTFDHRLAAIAHLMILSLHRPAVRAVASSSEFICLACRATRQLPAVAVQQSRSASSLNEPALDENETLKEKAARLTIQNAYTKACKKAKTPRPKILVKGEKKNGYVARVELDGNVLETPPYSGVKLAKAKVKLMVIDHINGQKSQGTTSDAPGNIATNREKPSKQSQPSASQRRVGLRGHLKTQKNQKTDVSSPLRAHKVLRPSKKRGSEAQSSLKASKADHHVQDPVVHQRRKTRSRSLIWIRKMRGQLLQARATQHTYYRPLLSSLRGRGSNVHMKSLGGQGIIEKSETSVATANSRKSSGQDLRTLGHARTVRPLALEPVSLEATAKEVPGLSYGLDRVLFNPGVYQIRDPRSRVYNFDPYLEKITDVRKFNFAFLDEYRRPSADDKLSGMAKRHDARYFSSTSNITHVLLHFHLLLSNWRPLKFSNISAGFFDSRQDLNDEIGFTTFSRAPQSVYLKPTQGGYAVDKADDTASIGLLAFIGNCLEKLFTVPKEVFESYLKNSTKKKPEPSSSGYHHTKYGSIVIRSQLDARDNRLPGTGIFDIKTRAVLPIRMDSLETSQNIGKHYEIKGLYGKFESFEREFFDMGRSTLMKYSLQARLGRMDGIFVAYHNIIRLFGFQYLSISDMDDVLHGQTDPALGDGELSASLHILSDIFDKAIERFPGEPLRLYFDARKRMKSIIVFVVPVKEEEIDRERENAHRQSREYLERLNQSQGSKDDAVVEKEEVELLERLLSESSESAVTEADAAVTTDDFSNQSENSATALEKGDDQSSIESLLDSEAIHDEVSRLLAIASKIRMETDVLQREGNTSTPRFQHIHKIMIADIIKKTYNFKRDVAKLAECLKRRGDMSNASYEAELMDLQRLVIEQSEINTRLFNDAERQGVVTDKELKNLSNVQTLEAALKAAAKHYTLPPRYAAFKIRAQSTIDGEITEEPPKNVGKDTAWELTYTIEDLNEGEDGDAMYLSMLQKKDSAVMATWESRRIQEYYESGFFKELMSLSEQGQMWRKERDRLDEEQKVIVFEPRG